MKLLSTDGHKICLPLPSNSQLSIDFFELLNLSSAIRADIIALDLLDDQFDFFAFIAYFVTKILRTLVRQSSCKCSR